MKGPYERLKYQMTRVWECPVCHRHERSGGQTTYRFCSCQDPSVSAPPVCMRLIRDGIYRTNGGEN